MRFLRVYGQYDQVYLCPCEVDVSFWFPSKATFATPSTAGEQIPVLNRKGKKREKEDYLEFAEISSCYCFQTYTFPW